MHKLPLEDGEEEWTMYYTKPKPIPSIRSLAKQARAGTPRAGRSALQHQGGAARQAAKPAQKRRPSFVCELRKRQRAQVREAAGAPPAQ